MNATMFNGNNLPHELLLTTRQSTKPRNAIENNMSTDIKLSKAQVSKIIQSGEFICKILGPLLKTGLSLVKSVLKALGLLGLTAASSAIDAGVQKKIYGSGTTTLVISNEEMNDIIKIVQALEDSNILLKGLTKTIKNETKEQRRPIFKYVLLGTLGASLLGDLLTKNLSRKGTVRAGEGIIRAGEGIKTKALMPPHPLTNFEIKEYYENEPRFNDVYSRDNLPKTIKSGAYVINLDEYADVGTHWIALYVKNNEVIYFDSFSVEHVPNQIKKFIGNKNITNLYRTQHFHSIMCGYFCVRFIDFMFPGKILIDFTSLFSPYDSKKNDKIILAFFK